MNTVKFMINSMFYITCRCLVLANKGGKTIQEQYAELAEAQKAYEMCRLLELTIDKAHNCHDISETEYKFVLSALNAAVDSEVGL